MASRSNFSFSKPGRSCAAGEEATRSTNKQRKFGLYSMRQLQKWSMQHLQEWSDAKVTLTASLKNCQMTILGDDSCVAL